MIFPIPHLSSYVANNSVMDSEALESQKDILYKSKQIMLNKIRIDGSLTLVLEIRKCFFCLPFSC